MSRNTRDLIDSVDHARIEAAEALTNLLSVLTDRRALRNQPHHATTVARRRATNAARVLAGAEPAPSWPWILASAAAAPTTNPKTPTTIQQHQPSPKKTTIRGNPPEDPGHLALGDAIHRTTKPSASP